MGITKAIIRLLLEANQDFMECHRDFERANMELSTNPIECHNFCGVGTQTYGNFMEFFTFTTSKFQKSGLNRTQGKIDLSHQSKKSDPQVNGVRQVAFHF